MKKVFDNTGSAVDVVTVHRDVNTVTNIYSSSSSLEFKDTSEIYFNLSQPVTSFTGRLRELNELENFLHCAEEELNELEKEEIVNSPAAVIIGLGGAGKTELARKYAAKHHNCYKNIIWIDSETFEGIKAEFKQLATHFLGIPGGHPSNVIVSKVYKRLMESKSLIIFDNAEGYASIKPFLPPMLKQDMGNIHVLFTSRIRDWNVADEGRISEIHLKEFEAEDAEEFIKESLNEKYVNDEDVTKLAGELEYFPLALKQAVAYINQRDYQKKIFNKKFEIEDYLIEFRCEAKKLLDLTGYSGYNRYTKTVFATLNLTFENLSAEKNGNQALDVLSVVAYLNPDNIDIQIFEALDEAVFLLEKYAILRIRKESARVHRLVQQVTRLRNKDIEVDCLRNAINFVNNNPSLYFHAMSVWSFAIKYYELIEEFYFSTYDRSRTPLHLFVILGNYEAAKGLLEIVDDHPSMKTKILSSADVVHGTPLRTAVLEFNYQFSELLLRHGAAFDVMAKDVIETMYSILLCHNWNLATLLIEKGFDVDRVDYFGKSLLYRTIDDNDPDIVKFLIDKGANVNAAVTNNFLHKAIDENDLEELKNLIENSVCASVSDCVNVTGDRASSLIFHTVEKNNLQMTKLLIEGGADVNATYHRGDSLLHYAISTNNFDITKFLIENGARVNAGHHRNLTLLHDEMIANKSDIARLLIEKGANVNAICNMNESPLHLAIRENKMDIAKLLAEHGGRISLKHYREETPIFNAIREKSTEILSFLIQNGADVNVTSRKHNPLHVAIDENDLAKLENLLKYFGDVNEVYIRSNTSLIYAVERNNSDITRLLIAGGGDVNKIYHRGESLLTYAISANNFDITKFLIQRGADVNALNDRNLTLLHRVIKSNKSDEAKMLIEKNDANVNTICNINESPLHLAIREDRMDIAKLLAEHGGKIFTEYYREETPIFNAIFFRNTKLVSLLIQKGVNVNTASRNQNLLHVAIDENDLEKLEILLENGADVNEFHHRTDTLLYAVSCNYLDITKLLIEAGADVNAIYHRGETLLHYAISANNFNIAKCLIEKGADVHARLDRNLTLLHLATRSNKTSMAMLLIENGADVNAICNVGESPLHFAIRKNRMNIAKLLEDHGGKVDCTFYCEVTPVYYALLANNTMLVNLLIQKEAQLKAALTVILTKYALLRYNLAKRNLAAINHLTRFCECFRCSQ